MQRANERLLKLLSDVVKQAASTEETINKQLEDLIQETSQNEEQLTQWPLHELESGTVNDSQIPPDSIRRPQSSLPAGLLTSTPAAGPSAPAVNFATPTGGATADLSEPEDATLTSKTDLSLLSDEGLELSQRQTDTIFQGPSLDEQAEELVIGRAKSCVEKKVRKFLVSSYAGKKELIQYLEEKMMKAFFNRADHSSSGKKWVSLKPRLSLFSHIPLLVISFDTQFRSRVLQKCMRLSACIPTRYKRETCTLRVTARSQSAGTHLMCVLRHSLCNETKRLNY